MTDYENFPTPDEIAAPVVEPIDDQWEWLVMDEIARLLRSQRENLRAQKAIRYAPVSLALRTGFYAGQWKRYWQHIADLVRERGWMVAYIQDSAMLPRIIISLPHVVQPLIMAVEEGEG